jgi:two-component system sensor histidine kinase UhpB
VLQKLWYDRPVRTQLLIAVGVINLLAAFLAGAVSILNTRTATRVEIEASLEVAQRFVAATMKDLASQGRLDELSQQLPLQLKHLRHVRIMFMDQIGQLTVVSPQASSVEDADQTPAPTWFSRLVRPQLVGRAVRIVAIDHSTPVVIVGEPADEIAEAWHDFSSLALVWLAINALILGILYVVLGRLLDPLASLSKGMLSLEDGHYATRLALPKVKELAVITERFNTLAGALDTARDENSRLYRQLITVQEEERREIANELHDEAGPCLFGITANASSIQNFADQLPEGRPADMISRRVGEILSITERLKLLNRALLKRLRPGPLGRVKLTELLDELIVGFQKRHPDTEISFSFGDLDDSYGEAIDLTLYRCIQEGITNAMRHGQARSMAVDLHEEPAPRKNGSTQTRKRLTLSLSDDG